VKTALYERHGVKEYWIMHPADGLLTIYELDGSADYSAPRIMELAGTVPVNAVPGLEIGLTEVAALCAQEYPPRVTRPSPGSGAEE
jgi:Uma2 family endonuclease